MAVDAVDREDYSECCTAKPVSGRPPRARRACTGSKTAGNPAQPQILDERDNSRNIDMDTLIDTHQNMARRSVAENFRNLYSILTNYSDIWTYLARQDLNAQFRRSRLGIAWLIINQLSFAVGGGFLWAALFGLDPLYFIPFIATGFAVWGFLAGAFVDGCGVFLVASGYIRQIPLPLPVYVYRQTMAATIRMLIGVAVSLGLVVLFGRAHSFNILLVLPGLFLLVLFALFTILAMAYAGARYRDLQHGLGNVFQILFVLTPVIYPPELLVKKGLGWAAYVNPFTALIEVVRRPLTEQVPAQWFEYGLVVLYIVIAALVAWFLRNRLERDVVYLI